ncbi:MAG: GGDEF domain-containing protein, partial [Pseudomonadota bacterium]
YLFARYEYGMKKQVRLHYESSMQDELTSLLNRRGIQKAVSGALAMTSAKTHATLLVDIDHFKSINDNHGHAAGDAVIEHLAHTIRQCLRHGDIPARLGGDEFLILAPNCDLTGAQDLAERLLTGVRAPRSGQVPPYTISIGISVEAHLGADFDEMYRSADAALYRAKAEGKDRYVVCVNAVT